MMPHTTTESAKGKSRKMIVMTMSQMEKLTTVVASMKRLKNGGIF